MNVAILGTEQASTIVAEIIEGEYNLWLEKNLAEPLKVVAYATGGGE